MHEENCFLTLTYNDQNLPKDKSLHKSEIQLFIKRLRKHYYPKRIRYYACGEYGNDFARPHYHACIFGHDFEDKEIHKRGHYGTKTTANTRRGEFDIYRSKTLEKLWPKGFSTIGEVTFDSAAYVARYITKKINGKNSDDHYQGKTPEFALMSRRPGIGNEWLDKYLTDVYPKDYVTMRGKKLRPVRYYDNQLMTKNFSMYEKVKDKRKQKTENPGDTRLYQMEEHRKQITKPLYRSYEYEGQEGSE